MKQRYVFTVEMHEDHEGGQVLSTHRKPGTAIEEAICRCHRVNNAFQGSNQELKDLASGDYLEVGRGSCSIDSIRIGKYDLL